MIFSILAAPGRDPRDRQGYAILPDAAKTFPHEKPGASVLLRLIFPRPRRADCQRTMNVYLTDSDYYAQQGSMWDYLFDASLRLAADIAAGMFDDDEPTMLEAEQLLKKTEDFRDDLLTV